MLLLLFLGLLVGSGKAQESFLSEELQEAMHDEAAAATVLELFEEYRRNPLCLYRATVGQLRRLPGMTAGIARRLVALVQRFPQLSYEALADTLALTPEQLWVLRQATTMACSPKPEVDCLWRSASTLPLVSVQGDQFLGAFWRFQGRGILRWRWLRMVLAWDRDAGEPGVADFVSMGLHVEPWEGLRWMVGDIRLSSALGMLSWGSGWFRSPGFEITSPLRWNTEAQLWASVQEYGFLRGSALQWEHRWGALRHRVVAYVSRTPKSARMDTAGIIRTILTDGVFATAQERAFRNTLQETAYGGVAEAEWLSLRIALGIMGLRYSAPVATESRQHFLGQSGVLASCAMGWQFGGGEVAGEVVRDARGNWAFHGAIAVQREPLQVVLAVRSVPDSFRSPYGAIVSRASSVSNEEGLYLGIAARFSRHSVQLYADLFRTPAPPYGEPVPRYGMEVGARWMWKARRWLELWWQLRYRADSDAERPEVWWQLVEQRVVSLRGDVFLRVSPLYRWRLRWEVRRQLEPKGTTAYFGMTGMELQQNSAEGAFWFAVYGVPTSALGFWVAEQAGSWLPRLWFFFGYGSYVAARFSWKALPAVELEATASILQRNSPLPLSLWGTTVRGSQIRLLTLATTLRL